MAVKLWKSRDVLRKVHLFAQWKTCWNLILRRSTCWEDTNFCIFYSGVNKILYWRLQVSLVHSALPLHLSWSPKTVRLPEAVSAAPCSLPQWNMHCWMSVLCFLRKKKNKTSNLSCGSLSVVQWHVFCGVFVMRLDSVLQWKVLDALLIAQVFLGGWCLWVTCSYSWTALLLKCLSSSTSPFPLLSDDIPNTCIYCCQKINLEGYSLWNEAWSLGKAQLLQGVSVCKASKKEASDCASHGRKNR